jgi:putative SOS response-associated peptidase YedK
VCGRFTLTASPEELARRFELDETPELEARFNVAPGQDVASVRQIAEGGRRVLELRRWGLVPPWADDPRIGNRLVNARAETARGKPAYRRAFQQRRCLIPADGFYEWAGGPGSREPYHVSLDAGELFGLAGLWERWGGASGDRVESCTILTTEANERLRPIHDRMPVILDPADYALWLDPAMHDPERLAALLRPGPAAALRLRRVSRRVNDAKLDEPSLLDPVVVAAEPAQLGLEFQE